MAASARPLIYPDTPEVFFSQPQNIAPGFPIDAITCQLARTAATVALLFCQFDGTCNGKIPDAHIANALWGVQADLERLQAMLAFGCQSGKEAA